MPDEREVGRRVKDAIIGTIRGTGEITEAAVGTVSSAVQRTVKEVGRPGAVPRTWRSGR
jgi:hypothetical protein